ncbi:hypothetical protein JYU34_016395 [Plutella xylostella]|uniref:Uncharacterized protein n=1 Tax=Plutella xylostella TaxID=51655 RepID=A0ABQ7Q6A1_PLUXY|nr:hypothetical protein JYU34_016395 [Plutella xylostella]
MLLSLILVASVLAPALCGAEAGDPADPQVLQMEMANMPNSYSFHYANSDGSSRTEEGGIQNPGTDQAALDVLGTVRWYDDKGQLYEMSYKAGKRGYRTVIKKVKS